MSDDEAPATDPDDLDFTADERVAEIDEDRYVVGTEGRPRIHGPKERPDDAVFESPDEPLTAAARDPLDEQPAGSQGPPQSASESGSESVDRQAVSRWLATSFEDDGFSYGLDVTLHVEGSTTRTRMTSNDVTATFDTLVSWFASNAGTDSPPPEALGLLLVAADTQVAVPPVVIKRFATSHGLRATDSIGDLIREAESAGGFRID